MAGAGAWPWTSARRATGGVRADSAPLVRIQHPLMTSASKPTEGKRDTWHDTSTDGQRNYGILIRSRMRLHMKRPSTPADETP